MLFDINIVNSIKTAGVFLLYEKKFAFMVGPDKSGERLGIVRLGGHIEQNEKIIDCVKREIREEASTDIQLVSSPTTYYKRSWEEETYEVLDNSIFDIKPILINGDKTRATVLFLAYAENQLIPAAEAYGIILLSEEDIVKICNEKITLSTFVSQGGELLQSQNMNFDYALNIGPHLRFLYHLIETNYSLVEKFVARDL